jgi:hypothetical protein
LYAHRLSDNIPGFPFVLLIWARPVSIEPVHTHVLIVFLEHVLHDISYPQRVGSAATTAAATATTAAATAAAAARPQHRIPVDDKIALFVIVCFIACPLGTFTVLGTGG